MSTSGRSQPNPDTIGGSALLGGAIGWVESSRRWSASPSTWLESQVGPPDAKYAVRYPYPHGIHTLDVAGFAIVAILLLGVAGLASWLPAHRSARVDPMVAPRSE